MKEKKLEYKWLIDTTGSNTYGTTFSSDATEYMENNKFEKIFIGSPLYGTCEDYTEEEISNICKSMLKMRENHGQNMHQIKGCYFKVESGSGYEASIEDIENRKNEYFSNKKPLSEEEALSEQQR